ncbi:Receptor-like protein kinase [Dichanthelium oligosanthes]|uniref:Receptor-like protein kinase n=1 Tax=Dichanthelium oligosanthes TaxID=888268 RepID=A0A1E5UJG2_9POAL|nr:Receptor-like protein kinase [Dichanthelium oligosanthes]
MAAGPWSLLLICLGAAATAGVLRARAQPDSIGFISIDCGLPGTAGYVDDATKLSYVPDAAFVTDAGCNRNISAEYITPTLSRRYLNVRSFPDGVRSCYALRSLVAGLKYIVRAAFLYGNYDGLRRSPVFDLYIGVNFWGTMNVSSPNVAVTLEAIVVVPGDVVQICLLNTGSGTPFISSLDLRPLKSTVYPQANATRGLLLLGRWNFGPTDATDLVRYPDDPHDRVWFPWVDASAWAVISTTDRVLNIGDEDLFEAPSKVLQTAITPRNGTNNIEFSWDREAQQQPKNQTPAGYIAVMHFSELQVVPRNAVREFYVNLNGKLWYPDGITPFYLSAGFAYDMDPLPDSARYNISINATANSTLPPFINAIEIFSVISTNKVGTDSQDVSAIMAIKMKYRVQKNWMGDPCVPKTLAWDGLTCSSTSPPKITAVYGNNSNLCTNAESCQTAKGKSKKVAVYVAVPVVLVVVTGLLATLFFCFLRRKKQGSTTNNSVNPQIETPASHVPRGDAHAQSSVQLENRRFTYRELETITNKFERVLGQGGFGKVYSGSLPDGTRVAVKLRSQNSNQGVGQFLAENLVSMIGYCKDGQHMALVYEYMSEGTLHEHITAGNGSNRRCLTWRQRLQMALESAQGLEYLHKGCNPPLIHRDVKATNILLNEKLEAKIADFGLSKAFDHNNGIQVAPNPNSLVVGTLGYIDPEYYKTNNTTTKSDVYSFGVVLLQLVSGRPAILHDPEPINITDWARRHLSRGNIEGVVDARMNGSYDVNSVWKVAEIALKCTVKASSQRPTMSEVVGQLQECLHLEEVHADDGATGSFYTGTNHDPDSGYNAYAADDGQSIDVR